VRKKKGWFCGCSGDSLKGCPPWHKEKAMAKKKGAKTYDEARNRQKEPVGLRLEHDVIERLRNAVYWIGKGLTVNGVIEEATAKALEELEARHNGGRPFAQRVGVIPKGRA
jgi:hypothetical protein